MENVQNKDRQNIDAEKIVSLQKDFALTVIDKMQTDLTNMLDAYEQAETKLKEMELNIQSLKLAIKHLQQATDEYKNKKL